MISMSPTDGRTRAAAAIGNAALLSVTIFAGAFGADARLAAFNREVRAYAHMRDSIINQIGPIERQTSPAQIDSYQKKLAAALLAKRGAAQQGNIFTPDVQAAFQQILQPLFAGPENRNLHAIRQGNPRTETERGETQPKVEVNAIYPKNASLSSMPPAVLLALPRLPKNLNYRFVGESLVLVDYPSNLIVDYMPRAVPAL